MRKFCRNERFICLKVKDYTSMSIMNRQTLTMVNSLHMSMAYSQLKTMCFFKFNSL